MLYLAPLRCEVTIKRSKVAPENFSIATFWSIIPSDVFFWVKMGLVLYLSMWQLR